MPTEYSTRLFAKVQRAFGEYAVDKRIASSVELMRLPRYVVEYLIGEFMAKGGDWEEKLHKFISEYYYEPKYRDLLLHKLTTEGTVRIIDELKVWVHPKTGIHYAVLPSLAIRDARVVMDIVEKNPNVLIMGMWGLLTLRYDSASTEGERGTPIIVVDFIPFQAPYIDVNLYEEARREFTLKEWVDVLINTIGLNHERYSFRQKLVFLTRLVPLVEGNMNLMEFGPRATGKTYVYRHVSHYTRIFSGGNVSPAVLFYNLRTKVPGEIAARDAVIFDEISKIRFTNPSEMMGKLKDYMESGHYERGDKRGVSTCSLVFMGNIEVELREEGFVPVEEFTYVLPGEMRDSAFVDRVHGIIPGWELPKIRQARYHLSQGYGVASDYFAELMHKMRKDTYVNKITRFIEFSENFTIRDERAVKKISSGLIKLLFPHGEWDTKEFNIIMDIAIEYRQRVREWLHILSPGEYPKEKLTYRDRNSG